MEDRAETGSSWFTTELFQEEKKRIERSSAYLDAFGVSKDKVVEAVQNRFAPKPRRQGADVPSRRAGGGRSTTGAD